MIKLTHRSTGKDVWLAPQHITYIKDNSYGKAVVYFTDGSYAEVRESPEQVAELLTKPYKLPTVIMPLNQTDEIELSPIDIESLQSIGSRPVTLIRTRSGGNHVVDLEIDKVRALLNDCS